MISRNGFGVEILHDGEQAPITFRDGYNYASLGDGCSYSIHMTNNTDDRVKAVVNVDGVHSGNFIIQPWSDLDLERPSQKNLGFTFHREGSSIARASGVVEGKQANGLISVRFIPEAKPSLPVYAEYESYDEYSDEPPPARSMKMSSMPRKSSNEPPPARSMNSSPSRSMETSSMPRKSSGQQSMKKEMSPRMSAMPMRQLAMPAYSSGATVLSGRTNQEFVTVKSIDEDFSRAVELVVRLVVDNRRSCLQRSRSRIPPRIEELPY